MPQTVQDPFFTVTQSKLDKSRVNQTSAFHELSSERGKEILRTSAREEEDDRSFDSLAPEPDETSCLLSLSDDDVSCYSSENCLSNNVEGNLTLESILNRLCVLELKVKQLEDILRCKGESNQSNILSPLKEILSLPDEQSKIFASHLSNDDDNLRTLNVWLDPQDKAMDTQLGNSSYLSKFQSSSQEEIMIQFGSESIPLSRIRKLRHKKDTILAAELCSVVFSPEEMTLCSMKGKVNNKSRGTFRKYRIDELKVQGIIDYVCKWRGVYSEELKKSLRIAIANKLGNFCKTKEGKFIIEQHKHKLLKKKCPNKI